MEGNLQGSYSDNARIRRAIVGHEFRVNAISDALVVAKVHNLRHGRGQRVHCHSGRERKVAVGTETPIGHRNELDKDSYHTA